MKYKNLHHIPLQLLVRNITVKTVLTSGIVIYVRKYRVQNVRKLAVSATTATLRFAKNVKRKRNIALNVVHHAA